MKKTAIAVLLSLGAAVAAAQQPAAPPAPASPKMDHDGCMGGSEGSAHAKAMAKHDAAWKQIEADLAAAKKATGEKKVAALEAVLENLVALHGEMRQGTAMKASDGHGMDCCAGKGATATAAKSDKAMDCCAGKGAAATASKSGKAMDCCGAGSDCCGGGMACCEHEGSAASAAPARK